MLKITLENISFLAALKLKEMILDRLENASLYNSLSENLKKGFDYLTNSDLESMPLGKYFIDDNNVYAIISEYETKEEEACKLEAHHKYIDIQYMISGCELIGIDIRNGQTIKDPYNEDKDVEFFEGESHSLKLEAGMFAVFFPNDLHRPGIKYKESETIKKVVVKVKVQ